MSGARLLHSFGKLKNITIYNKLKIITLKKVRQSLTRIILRIDPRLG